MKTTIFRYIFLGLFLVILAACSVRKDTFMSRNSHALATKYNILYNGGLALDKGLEEVKLTYKDNYWEILPIERMQPEVVQSLNGQPPAKNANFERAEEKATKAIQKHSMNIDGTEKNFQIDEAYLMLGKARYYDNRFVPALDAFNYVLYKYPKSDKIYEAKIWREKTNVRLENDVLALTNLKKLLKEIKFKDQAYADANAIMAQAYLNLEEKDSAIVKLKNAVEFTKSNDEKARYRFISGQLYEAMGYKDSAFAAYQSVIEMNRKSPRQYVIQAHARQAQQFNSNDTVAFMKKFNKLLKDRENRPFLDVLNHQVALFYDRNKNSKQAVKYYNKSLNAQSTDTYLVASNYRNLAEINFNEARYVKAGLYYDSTLVQLQPRSREFKLIQKKRANLEDVIKYEAIATTNDSILSVVGMSESAREKYYSDYIAKLKKDDEIKRKEAEKQAREAEIMAAKNGGMMDSGEIEITDRSTKSRPKGDANANAPQQATPGPKLGLQGSTFYFYNPTTVAFGKAEFRKNWGNRAFKENWRTSASKKQDKDNDVAGNETDAAGENDTADNKEKVEDPRYTTAFYTSKLPTDQKVLDSLAKDRNFAYYQLGIIYKEKFKEYKRAADKLERLLEGNPEERLVLPSMYHLYKIYEIIDREKAATMKNRIVNMYPDSRYAQILNNANSESTGGLTPEAAYGKLFKIYESGDYITALAEAETAVDQFTGEESIPKFELLKARLIGKLRGIEEYKKALNFVALNYPNSAEGKEAETLLASEIPALAALQFSGSPTESWKILYKAKDAQEKGTKILMDKIKKFLTDREWKKLKMSLDIYTETDNFVVIHGLVSEDNAKGIASILKDFKEYKVADAAIVISSQNYEVVQIKKNIDEYLSGPQLNPKSVVEQLPGKTRQAAPAPNAPPAKRAEREPSQNQPKPNEGMPMPPQGTPQQGTSTPGKNDAPRSMAPPSSIGMPPTDSAPKK